MVSGAEHFSGFANFKFEEERTPDLPLEAGPEIITINKHHGSFTTSIEIDEDSVAKVNRVLRIDKLEFVRTGNFPEGRQYPTSLAAVAPRVEIPNESDEDDAVREKKEKEENLRLAVEATLRLAKTKREAYETLQEYLGDYLPELKFFSVVESPRRVLEEHNLNITFREGKKISEEVLQNIPTSEITLMEIWENVGPKNSLDDMPYDKLASLFQDENFSRQQKDFSEKAFRLFVDRGIMLDICDRGGGIRYKTPEGRIKKTIGKVKGFNFEDALRILEDTDQESLPLARNIASKDGQLKYYDTYPVWNISNRVPNTFIPDLIMLMEDASNEEIDQLLKGEDDSYDQDKVFIFQYLALLKHMGLESFDMGDMDIDSYKPSTEQQNQASLLTGILETCEQEEITVSVIGGYGQDGLYGRLTRPHGDIDMLVEDDSLEKFKGLLELSGFELHEEAEGRYVYGHSHLLPDFKLEFAVTSQLEKISDLPKEEYIPQESNASLNGVRFRAPTLCALKQAIEIQNARAAQGNWGSYRIDKRRNQEALLKAIGTEQNMD